MLATLALLLTTLPFTAVAQRPAAGRTSTMADTACRKMRYASDPDTMSSQERNLSPLDSVTFHVEGASVKICYSRPSARGRTMIGGEDVPYGQFWRTGANEPTYLFTSTTLAVGGLTVPPGAYSLYTLPGETEWVVVLNRSLTHWGFTLQKATQAQDLGSTTIRREWTPAHVETFTIRPDPDAAGMTAIVLEWERTRLRIPVARPTKYTRSDAIRHCVRDRGWNPDITPPAGLCYPIQHPGPSYRSRSDSGDPDQPYTP